MKTPLVESSFYQIAKRMQEMVLSHWEKQLHKNTYVLTGNFVITTIFGFGFWALATRLISPSEVGIATAFIAPTNFLSTLFLLGTHHALLRYGEKFERDPSLIFSTMWITTSISLLGGFIAGLILVQTDFIQLMGSSYTTPILYGLLVSGGVVWTLADAAAVALRSPWNTVGRGIAFGLVRIILLLALIRWASLGIAVTYTAALVLGAIASLGLLAHNLHASMGSIFRMRHRGLAELLNFAAPNHLVNVVSTIPTAALPLLCLRVLGPESTALFGIAWTVSSALRAVIMAFSASLLAEGARDESLLGSRMGSSARFALALIGLVGLPMVLAPKLVLFPFGRMYAEGNAVALPVFALSMAPSVFTTLFLAKERVRGRVRFILAWAFGSSLLGLGLPYVGARGWGYSGFAYAYLLSQALLALAVFPFLGKAALGSSGHRYLDTSRIH